MSYPDYPSNRLIVDDVDLTEEYGIILLDGYTIDPPEPKTYMVDIPGGDGKLDLTDILIGRTAYNTRTMSFNCCVINVDKIELMKSKLNSFLHGKMHEFSITMDPGYIYKGRFSVSEYSYAVYDVGKVLAFKITIEADPYKKMSKSYSFDAVGGILCTMANGYGYITPTVTSGGNVKVIFENKVINIESPEWKSDNFRLREGDNVVYLNSHEIHNLTWGDISSNGTTWSDFKGKKLFEWYKSVGEVDQSLAEAVKIHYDRSDI